MAILNGTSGKLYGEFDDTTAPVLQTIATSTDGLTVTATYNEALDTGSTPANTDMVFSPVKTITNTQVTGQTVIWTVSVAFGSGDTILGTYTAGANPIQDTVGNDAANFTNQAVTNNVSAAYSTTAQAVIDRMSSLSTAEKDAIATFVDSQASAEGGSGNWELLDEFWCYALNSTDAPKGWKATNSTNNGATHTGNGYSFDGSNDYVDTNVDLNTLTNYALDDCLIGMFTQAYTAGVRAIGVSDGTATAQMVYSTDESALNKSGTAQAHTDLATKGLFVVARTTSSKIQGYTDGTADLNPNQSSASIPSGQNLCVGCLNNNGSNIQFSQSVISCVFVGAASGFDHSDFDTDLDTLLTTLGVTT